MVERRAATRFRLPPGIEASIGGVSVLLVDLSSVGARVEHEERFPLTAPHLRIAWQGSVVSIPLSVARSEIVGRRESRLVYQTGVEFSSLDATAEGVIAALIRLGASSPSAEEAAPAPVQVQTTPKAPEPSLDDSWIRQVRFRREELDEQLPYAQFRLIGAQWEKSYVATPDQPADGFTILRDALDFHELQRTFESADPDTRRMMQIALESQLKRA